MSDNKLSTKYAPAERLTRGERLTREELERQSSLFQKSDFLLGKIPVVFIVVNKYRQIVYMNKGALEFTGLEDVTSVIGVRLGELLGCIHTTEEEGGCISMESCTYFGAINAVLESQKDKFVIKDCQLHLENEQAAVNLRVWASPLVINKEKFIAVTLQDIQPEKWRVFKNRIFFHDILNKTNILQLTFAILTEFEDYKDKKGLINKAAALTKRLIEEILSQRLLIDADNNIYEITLKIINSIDFLNDIINTYVEHKLTENKTLKIALSSESIDFYSDRTLLRRILNIMIKNALEVTPKDGTVTIGYETIGENIKFWVHNPGFIPQLQIFNRSFSTKSQDRGLETYTIKLLSSFLKGTINFTTSEENGTTFNAVYPIKLGD